MKEVIIKQLGTTAYLCLGKKSLSHESLGLDKLTSPFLKCSGALSQQWVTAARAGSMPAE